MKKTHDYSITLQDSTGKTLEVAIDGASIDNEIRNGATEAASVEGVEQNAFANAIYNGNIGADCWIVSINR